MAEVYARAEGLYNAQLTYFNVQIQNKLILERVA